MDNLALATIREMSRVTRTPLTDRHLAVLKFAHSYYEKHRVGPLFANIAKHTSITRDELDRLFPHGLQSVYTWVGIPIQSTSTGCKPMAAVDVENPRSVYLDHNATTYVREEVAEVFTDFIRSDATFGNPSSSTALGSQAHRLVSQSREKIAACLQVEPEHIVFTGSGSEANNLAIKGIAFKHLHRPGHIIASALEHACVLESLRFLERLGFRVTLLPCTSDGLTTPESVRNALRPDTILACIMAVNNEIGVINPIPEIGRVCRTAGVPLLVDAVQALGKLELRPADWGVSLMSMSAHKIYAPKGVGALYVAPGLQLLPLIHGGGQENGLRSGTENVGGILSFGVAAELAVKERQAEQNRLRELRNYLLEGLRAIEPGLVVNGSLECRVANNLHVGWPGVDSGSLLLSLNRIGVYVSSGSACHAGAGEVSHVVRALGLDTTRYGTIRFSLGRRTSKADLDYLLTYLPQIASLLKRPS